MGRHDGRGGDAIVTGRGRAWLELARISNLPTIWSNVLVGTALAGRAPDAAPWTLPTTLCLLVGVSCLYVAGMAFNDVVDAPRDRTLAPERPIPSGRVTRSAAAWFAALLALGGAALVIVPAPRAAAGWALALVLAIVLYDLLHARWSASVVLMGACRGLVYLLAASVTAKAIVVDSAVLVVAATMTAYIIVLTGLARGERRNGIRGLIAFAALPALIPLPLVVLRPESWAWPIGAGLLAVIWLVVASRQLVRVPPRPASAVMGWLAGIALVDAWFLMLLDEPGLAAVAAGCFVITALGHRRISGT